MNPHPAVRVLLWPAAVLFGAVVRLRAFLYRRGLLRQKRLNGAVISVGNLTVGGTGKTPMVLRLAGWMGENGLHAAVLTRGYGRWERMPLVINGRGQVADYKPELMGDEPILLARHLPDVKGPVTLPCRPAIFKPHQRPH